MRTHRNLTAAALALALGLLALGQGCTKDHDDELGSGVATVLTASPAALAARTAQGSTASVGSSAASATVTLAAFSGSIPFTYTLTSPDSTPFDVTFKYSTDGGVTWTTATEAPGDDGEKGLETSPTGVTHTFIWDSLADLGTTSAKGVLLKIKPKHRKAAISAPFDVDDSGTSTTDSTITVDRGPYLQATTSTSITICWRTTTLTDTLIAYGVGTDASSFTGMDEASETSHVVGISGLKPGTTYSYYVLHAGKAVTETKTFTTAPDTSAASFSCIVFGDSGEGTSNQMDLATLMDGETFDFALHTGDVIYPAGEAENYDPNFFTPYGHMLGSHPIFPAVGNHDLEQPAAKPYTDVFQTFANNSEGSKLYYSFDWGDAHFVSLDTWSDTFRGPGAGLTWLKADLAASTKRWLVVFMHVPLYSIGHHGDDDVLKSTLGPIFESHKVDLLLAGHDHDYERSAPIKAYSTDPDFPGVPYIVTGGGGAKIRKSLSPRDTTLASESVCHYVKLVFTHDAITGTATRVDGSAIETFTISHK